MKKKINVGIKKALSLEVFTLRQDQSLFDNPGTGHL